MRTSTTPRPGRRARRLVAGLGLVALIATGCSSSGDDEADKTTTTKAGKTTEKTTTTEAEETTTTMAGGATGWDQDAQANRGQDGETFTIECPEGGEASIVWGTGTYTDDSSVCTAAVQSGLISLEEGGEVTYEIAPGLDEYEGGTANGVTSLRYGSWDGSFTFPDAPPGSVEFGVGAESWSRNANDVADEVGSKVTVECSAGGTAGSVWGSDPYTTDSSICTAAVHAGLLTLEDGGIVTIEIAEGEEAYEGTTANGVTSSSYGSWGSSFTFPEEQPSAEPTR